jgi:hypothetical protein
LKVDENLLFMPGLGAWSDVTPNGDDFLDGGRVVVDPKDMLDFGFLDTD